MRFADWPPGLPPTWHSMRYKGAGYCAGRLVPCVWLIGALRRGGRIRQTRYRPWLVAATVR